MRKRIDPRVIGSFVIGAVILVVAGLIFFGPGGLFSETRKYVVYFDSSVKGLNVGSPVRFRGVKVGQVSDINIRVKPSTFQFHIPVVIEILPSRIRAEGSQEGLFDALKTPFKGRDPMLSLVEKGLRVQLQLDSLVTGQLFVNMDMLPDTPIQLTGHLNDYPELPSVNSSFEELTQTIEDIPLNELAEKLIKSAEGFEKLINSQELHRAIRRLDETTLLINSVLTTLNSNIGPVTDSLQTTMARAQQTITNLDRNLTPLILKTRQTISKLDAKIDPASMQLEESLGAVKAAANTTSEAAQQLKDLTSDDSATLQRLNTTLKDLHDTSRSLRYFAKELEQDPQILLRGHIQGDNQ